MGLSTDGRIQSGGARRNNSEFAPGLVVADEPYVVGHPPIAEIVCSERSQR